MYHFSNKVLPTNISSRTTRISRSYSPFTSQQSRCSPTDAKFLRQEAAPATGAFTCLRCALLCWIALAVPYEFLQSAPSHTAHLQVQRGVCACRVDCVSAPAYCIAAAQTICHVVAALFRWGWIVCLVKGEITSFIKCFRCDRWKHDRRISYGIKEERDHSVLELVNA